MSRHWIRSSFLALASVMILSIALPATPVRADPLTPFKGPAGVVTVDDVRPHYSAPENKNNSYYSEWWSVVFFLEGGYGAYVRFLITNMGLKDGAATVNAEFRLDDGEKLSERTDLTKDQWSAGGSDVLDMKLGDNSLSGPIDGLVLKVKNDSFEAEYKLTNIAPPWKPGNGKAQYGASAGKYFQIQIPAPVAAVTGTVRIPGEKEPRIVKGVAIAEHQIMSVGMHEQAKRWMRYRAISASTTFIAADIETPDVFGNAHIQYAVLFKDGKKVFDTTAFKATMGDELVDTSKPEYHVPRLIRLDWTGEAGTVKAAIKANKLTGREDYLESSNAVERFVVSKFAKPILYDFNGPFAAEVTEGGKTSKFGGDGRYFFTVVNP